jgi:anti-anti-sigma factor
VRVRVSLDALAREAVSPGPVGALRAGFSPAAKQPATRIGRQGVRKLLLNLGDLTQIDSSCFSIIVGTRASLKGRGGDLKLLRPGGHVLDAFRVLHLLNIISSFEDETQALASFRPG